uniref:ATP synthase complex subunit 8 n=1 Tax=Phrynoderma hexadactylum TaxID=2927596 RepID=E1NZ32_PHRHX|nr:ATP synthase F0 subunit 8 [Phrynoderma hexadactylum]BAJ21259.1 ATPase 8 [Phrynoderma hexadactylum]
MPQLLPDPWWTIFLFTWVIFLLFAPLKTLSFKPLNNPTTSISKTQTTIWPWMW